MHLLPNLHHHHLMDTACINSKHLYYFHFTFCHFDLHLHINPQKEGLHCIYFWIHFHLLYSLICIDYLHSHFQFSYLSLFYRLLFARILFITILAVFLFCHFLAINSFDSFENLHKSLSFFIHLFNQIYSNHWCSLYKLACWSSYFHFREIRFMVFYLCRSFTIFIRELNP